MSYTRPIQTGDTLLTRMDFEMDCRRECLIDYDGYGHPVREVRFEGGASALMADPDVVVSPSDRQHTLPRDATHVVWYNR